MTRSSTPAARPPCGTGKTEERDDEQAHPVRPRRGQARRPGPHRRPVLAARLQHRLPGGRPDRALRHLADDGRRRRRGVPARAGDQAAQQAGRGPQGRRARPERVGAASGRPHQGAGRPDHAVEHPRDRGAVPRQGDRRRARQPDHRVHRQVREGPGATARPRALRGARARPVRDRRRGPRSSVDHRPEPAHRLSPPGPTRADPGRPGPTSSPAYRKRLSLNEKELATMAEMFYDDDADLSVIQGKKVAVIGYGSQGHAHALNLRDSGVDVRVGLAEGSKSKAKAEAEGLTVKSVADAVKEADLVVILTPDQVQRHVYANEIQPNLKEGAALLFGHGFNIRFGYIKPEPGSD